MQGESNTVSKSARWSDENILELLKQTRNGLIKNHLDDHHLAEHLAQANGLKEISSIKLEFIKRSLKVLQDSPIDQAHYAQLYLAIRKSDTAAISEKDLHLFHEEIKQSIQNYLLH